MHDFLTYEPPSDRPADEHVQLMIGKVASLYDITVQTLRHYDKIGLFRPEVINPETGYRYYSLVQLRQLEYILFLRRLELTLPEIQTAMEDLRAGVTLKDVLSQRDEALCQEIERLQQLRDTIGSISGVEEAQHGPLNRISISHFAPPRHFLFRNIAPLPVADPRFPLTLMEARKALLGEIPPIQTNYGFGATVSLGDYQSSGVLRYSGVLLDPGLYGVAPPPGMMECPEGDYAVIVFDRDQTRPEDAYRRLSRFLTDHHIRSDDMILEIGKDASFSSISRVSQITELQVRVFLNEEDA